MKYNTASDNELWKAFLLKDKKAFEQLYRRYFSSLLYYATSIGYKEEFVEDCIQDLFVKLFLSDTLNEVKYIKAYLFRALRNCIYDKIHNSPHETELDETISNSIESNDLYFDHLFLNSDIDIIKKKLLLKNYQILTNNQKSVIYLYYIKDLSWEEMSIALNISPHSCMNLLSRAIVRLRILFEKDLKNIKNKEE